MDVKEEIETASVIAHWSSGPVFCCLEHAVGLQKLGEFMGLHVHLEPYSGDALCTNCVNEKSKKR